MPAPSRRGRATSSSSRSTATVAEALAVVVQRGHHRRRPRAPRSRCATRGSDPRARDGDVAGRRRSNWSSTRPGGGRARRPASGRAEPRADAGGGAVSYTHVLVGTDGSKTAGRAVDAAAASPPRSACRWWSSPRGSATARPAGAVRGGALPGRERRRDGRAVGHRVDLGRRWRRPASRRRRGRAAAAAHRRARRGAARGRRRPTPTALLVVGTAGLGDRAERLVGNVPHQLTHHSPVDLLLVHRPRDERRPATVALATDGSRTAGRAVDARARARARVGAERHAADRGPDPRSGAGRC